MLAAMFASRHVKHGLACGALVKVVLVLATHLDYLVVTFGVRATVELNLQRLYESHEVFLHRQTILGVLFQRLYLIGQLSILFFQVSYFELVLFVPLLERLD